MQTFRIGDLEIKGLCDGLLETTLDLLIGMERPQADALVGGTRDGRLSIPVNNFMFERDGNIVMIDAGAGNTMQPTLGKLPEALRSAGTDPSAVTHIVLTHIHPDHANGLVDDSGAALYPNAEILVHGQEFDFWMAENDGTEPPNVTRQRARNRINLAPYLERIRRMRDGEEMLGCSPILAPGHCPGHTCWRIDAGREALIAWGDIVHFSAIQMSHPHVAVTYDLDPDRARKSRMRVLDMVAADRIAVAGAHVNAPGLGYVRRAGTGYVFEPAG